LAGWRSGYRRFHYASLRKEVGDEFVAEQIICECRKLKGPVLIHKGAHRAQRYVFYGLPAEALIGKKWKLIE
jgi:hypothetical protein